MFRWLGCFLGGLSKVGHQGVWVTELDLPGDIISHSSSSLEGGEGGVAHAVVHIFDVRDFLLLRMREDESPIVGAIIDLIEGECICNRLKFIVLH